MRCPKCGAEAPENTKFCQSCGEVLSVQQPQQPQEDKKIATCAVAFAFLLPIVGLILGIVGAVKYKDAKLKKQCIIAIPLSIVVWIIGIVCMLL